MLRHWFWLNLIMKIQSLKIEPDMKFRLPLLHLYINRMSVVVILLSAIYSTENVIAASPQPEVSVYDMTIDENIATPAVPAKNSNTIIRHMQRIGAVYSKHGLEVKPVRKGEVLKIVVPCNVLFEPNDTVLSMKASQTLNAFKDLVKLPELYKILIVVHSDNTGSDEYLDNLTHARANAIDQYFESIYRNSNLNIIPYGVGNDEPRQDNNSISARDANRRVDFYIIPEKRTIDMAKSNKL